MEKVQVNVWNGLYDGVTNAMRWTAGCWGDAAGDVEPAALGRMRTDGDYAHGAPGDGLSILDEYRGYVLDGGANGFAAGHHRLSFARKELLVHVREMPGLAQENSFNPNALSTYDLGETMRGVADFYANPLKGMGVDLYWVETAFIICGVPVVDETGYITHNNSYCYSGKLSRIGEPLNSDVIQVNTLLLNDYRLSRGAKNRRIFLNVFHQSPEAFGEYIHSLDRDGLLHEFCKLSLVNRISGVIILSILSRNFRNFIVLE